MIMVLVFFVRSRFQKNDGFRESTQKLSREVGFRYLIYEFYDAIAPSNPEGIVQFFSAEIVDHKCRMCSKHVLKG